jgi:hypothetical protein
MARSRVALESLRTESFAVDVLDKDLCPNDEYNIIKGTVVTDLCVLPDAVNPRPLSRNNHRSQQGHWSANQSGRILTH